MATVDELLAEIDANLEPELSLPEKVLGYSRSYLSGPTFNFADNIEAGIASLFTPLSYDEELSNIRAEQDRFKRKTDYLDNIVEIGSGAILNPLDKLRTIKDIGTGINTAKTLLTSAPAQAALAGAGAADGEDVLEEAAISSLIGAGGSALASVGGSALEKSARAADRFKLGAYDIGAADINRQLKKLGDSAASLGDAGNIPIVQTLKRAENKGLIDAGSDLLTNAKNLNTELNTLGSEINGLIKTANKVVPASPTFQWKNTLDYIDSISGKGKDQATSAALAELEALESQLGSGTLSALQKAKVGLNYKYDKNPYTEDIVKSIRQDIKEEIENRVDNAVRNGLLPEEYSGRIKELNSEWGSFKDLQDTFVRHGSSDLQGTPIDDLIRGGSTTGGVGSLNVASAASGNPLYSALGALLSASRVPESQSAIADVLRDPAVSVPLKTIGKSIPELFSARNIAQMRSGTESGKPKSKDVEVKDLLSEIDKYINASKSETGEKKDKKPQKEQLKPQKGQSGLSEQLSLRQQTATKGSTLSIPSLFDVTDDSDASQSPSIFDVATEDQLLDALREVESGGGKYLLSPAGARGAYQFMPASAAYYGVDLFDNDESDDREGARQYLKDEQEALLDRALALAAYNAGRPAVSKAIAKAGARDFESIAPYLPEETRNYVPAIERALKKLMERSA